MQAHTNKCRHNVTLCLHSREPRGTMWADVPVLSRYMEIQMTIEELETKRAKAYARLKPLELGTDYADAADAYEYAFNLVDDALGEAISHLKEYRKVIYPSPDRDILNPRS